MRKMCWKLREEASRLRCQLFTAYFVLFAAFFILVVLMLTTMVRGLLVDQIGGSRLDVLRQIAERANIVKTSSVTLSNLYTYEISSHRYLQGQSDEESLAEAASYLDRQKQVYDEVFAHIGLGYEVLFLGENGFSYCSDPSADWQETVPGQLWYRHLLEDLKNSQQGGVEFSRTFPSVTGSGEGFQFAAGRIVTGLDGNGVLLILIDEQLLENLYSSVQGQGSEIFIYDQDGLVVSHSNKKMLGKQFFDVDYMRQTYGVDIYDIVSRQGIAAADPLLLEMARVYRFSRKALFRAVYLPALLPPFLSAARVGLGFAWKAGIAGEVIAIASGSMGYRLYTAKTTLATVDLFAWTGFIILLSCLLERGMVALMDLGTARLAPEPGKEGGR